MRRLFLAIVAAVVVTAAIASITRAQQSLRRPTQPQGEIAENSTSSSASSAPTPSPSSSTSSSSTNAATSRGARYLLRNGLDYLKYQEYERALGFLREAELRQSELGHDELVTLSQGIERAQKGLRDEIQAVTQTQTGSGPVATPGISGTSVTPTIPAVTPAPVSELPQIVSTIPGPTPIALPPLSQPQAMEMNQMPGVQPLNVPAMTNQPNNLADPNPAPVQPSTGIAGSGAEPKNSAMMEIAPMPGLPPLPGPDGKPALAQTLNANAVRGTADSGVMVAQTANQDVPAPTPPENPAPAPADGNGNGLVLVPTPANAPAAVPTPDQPGNLPIPSPTDPGLSQIPTAPPVSDSPTPLDINTLPQLPGGAPNPTPNLPGSVSPTPTPATVAQPTPAPTTPGGPNTIALPPLPAADPANRDAGSRAPRRAPSEVALQPTEPRQVPTVTPAPAPSPFASRPLPNPDRDFNAFRAPQTPLQPLPPDIQREVDRIARLQRDEGRGGGATPPTPDGGRNASDGGLGMLPPETAPSDLTSPGQALVPRAPSPTEARPLRAIPAPEDFVPLAQRKFSPYRKNWAAAAACNSTLYFQDPVLERYGQSMEAKIGHVGRFLSYPIDDPKESNLRAQIAQPFFSFALFGFQFFSLPYAMVVDPPWEAHYNLGFFRPGDKVPDDVYYLPHSGVGPPLHGKNY